MPQPQKVKMTISLSIDANIWLLYRQACQEQTPEIKPSHEVEAFMQQRLATLLRLPIPQEESDHA